MNYNNFSCLIFQHKIPPNCIILIKFKSNNHIGRCCTTKKSTHLYVLKEKKETYHRMKLLSLIRIKAKQKLT